MRIELLVDHAIRIRFLSPLARAEIGRILDHRDELSGNEYVALARLEEAIQTGRVNAPSSKQFHNLMEKLVWEEALAQLSPDGGRPRVDVDFGDPPGVVYPR